MSHFTTLVLTHDGQKPEDLLAPFDEDIRVSPYAKPCSCIGRAARLAERLAVEERAKVDPAYDIDALRKIYWALPEAERTDARWDSMLAPIQALREQVFEAHPLKNSPTDEPVAGVDWSIAPPADDYEDPRYDGCGGTGLVWSTYSPKAKWDWYRLGGRWKGQFTDEGKDVFPLSEWNGKMPFAVITPDGAWHEKGDMGWWGMVSDEKAQPDWNREARALIEAHPDAMFTAFDLHI